MKGLQKVGDARRPQTCAAASARRTSQKAYDERQEALQGIDNKVGQGGKP
jgi:hypothetical protein